MMQFALSYKDVSGKMLPRVLIHIGSRSILSYGFHGLILKTDLATDTVPWTIPRVLGSTHAKPIYIGYFFNSYKACAPNWRHEE